MKKTIIRLVEWIFDIPDDEWVVTGVKRKMRGWLGFREEQWLRVVMNQETRKLVSAIEPVPRNVLEISGQYWEKFGFSNYRKLFYPEFNICDGPLDEQFDLIIAEQVFEHLLWPYRAGKNVYTNLNSGGYFLVTTPFLVRVHEHPTDCSRWTQTGIRHFLAECGFSLDHISTGAWGNRSCITRNFPRWIHYHPWLHSLKNETLLPAVVWALAKK